MRVTQTEQKSQVFSRELWCKRTHTEPGIEPNLWNSREGRWGQKNIQNLKTNKKKLTTIYFEVLIMPLFFCNYLIFGRTKHCGGMGWPRGGKKVILWIALSAIENEGRGSSTIFPCDQSWLEIRFLHQYLVQRTDQIPQSTI